MATNAEPNVPQPPHGGDSGVAQAVITLPNPQHPCKLSDEFAMILREFEVETVTLREVLALLHGRGYVLLIMFLALPFCTPIPLPGLSTPLGLIIAIIGGRLALGTKPWLPAKLLDTRLPPETFKKVFVVTRKIVLWFEKLLRPRLNWVTGSPWLEQIHAVSIVVCALMLLLPLPIPFSNIVPAWAILLLAGGMLERDGVFILAGHVATLVAGTFFVVLAIFGKGALDSIWQRLTN